MKKRVGQKKPAARPSPGPQVEPQAGADIAGLIGKMMQQLITLERKIDSISSAVSFGVRRPDGIRSPDPVQPQPERKQENGFRERVLHKAVCAECNKECQVPFRPSGDRPVYCKECFAKRKNGSAKPAAKPENRPADRVVIYERSFHKDQAALAPKMVEKKRPAARRKR